MNKIARQLIALGKSNPQLRDEIRPVLDHLNKTAIKANDPMVAAAKAWLQAAADTLSPMIQGKNPKVDPRSMMAHIDTPKGLVTISVDIREWEFEAYLTTTMREVQIEVFERPLAEGDMMYSLPLLGEAAANYGKI